MTAAARSAIASRKTSRGCTSDELRIPRVTVMSRSSRCCASSTATWNSSTGRSSSRGANSRDDVARRPDRRASSRALGRHPPAELERGVDGDRTRRPDARDARVSDATGCVPAAAAIRRAPARSVLARPASADRPPPPAPEQEREQLGRAERVRAEVASSRSRGRSDRGQLSNS